MRSFFLFAVAVVIALGGLATPADAANKNLVTVTVVGMGQSERDAIKDAKRKAVEQVAGTLVYSESKTKDFALIRDTVLTRSAGFVQDAEVLSRTITDDGIYEVKLRVTVSRQGIVDTWGVVTNLLKDMGRPKIMVFIREKVGNDWQESPTVQTRVENRLLRNGFLLVDRDQLKAIDKKDIQAAIAEDKPEKIQAIAKKFGAQIFITGVAQATTSGARNINGRIIHIYEADANVKIFRSDTAQLLGSIPGRATRGAQDIARSAAKQALDAQGRLLAPIITNDILRFWMDVMDGRGEVQLKIDGISFSQYAKLKKALTRVEGVNDLNAKYSNKTADISIESDMQAEKLAEKLAEDFEDKLEITDVSQNVIKADYKDAE